MVVGWKVVAVTEGQGGRLGVSMDSHPRARYVHGSHCTTWAVTATGGTEMGQRSRIHGIT